MGDAATCPKAGECAFVELKCHLCVHENCFKSGRSTGKGRHHEKQIVKALNTARRRAGSGSVAHAKGDVIDAGTLIEGKSGYTQINGKGQKSFALKRGWLLKIEQEAIAEGKLPVLVVHFDGTPDDELWAVTRLEVLQDLRAEQ